LKLFAPKIGKLQRYGSDRINHAKVQRHPSIVDEDRVT
jgi:hypothetical protein